MAFQQNRKTTGVGEASGLELGGSLDTGVAVNLASFKTIADFADWEGTRSGPEVRLRRLFVMIPESTIDVRLDLSHDGFCDSDRMRAVQAGAPLDFVLTTI